MFFHLGGSLGKNISVLLASRLFSGLFGACRAYTSVCYVRWPSLTPVISALTNAGGVMSDLWIPRERGLASSLYATAPYFGPREVFLG